MRGICTKKLERYLNQGPRKSRFPLIEVDGQTDIRTDICFYRVALLLKNKCSNVCKGLCKIYYIKKYIIWALCKVLDYFAQTVCSYRRCQILSRILMEIFLLILSSYEKLCLYFSWGHGYKTSFSLNRNASKIYFRQHYLISKLSFFAMLYKVLSVATLCFYLQS